jgi:hypothetical protein
MKLAKELNEVDNMAKEWAKYLDSSYGATWTRSPWDVVINLLSIPPLTPVGKALKAVKGEAVDFPDPIAARAQRPYLVLMSNLFKAEVEVASRQDS